MGSERWPMLAGVYVKIDKWELRFLRLPRPSEDEVYDVAKDRHDCQIKRERRRLASTPQSNAKSSCARLSACVGGSLRCPRKPPRLLSFGSLAGWH